MSSNNKPCTYYFHLLQPLEAIDVCNAVVYALSSPPHVQVCGFFKHTSLVWFKICCYYCCPLVAA